jgi:hypothetical protein
MMVSLKFRARGVGLSARSTLFFVYAARALGVGRVKPC